MTYHEVKVTHPMAPAPTRNTLEAPSLCCTSVPYTAICPSYLHPCGATRAADSGCKEKRKIETENGLERVRNVEGDKEGRRVEGDERGA